MRKTKLNQRALSGEVGSNPFGGGVPLDTAGEHQLLIALAEVGAPNVKKEPTEIKVEEKRSKQGRIMLICSITVTAIGSCIALYYVIRHLIDLFF